MGTERSSGAFATPAGVVAWYLAVSLLTVSVLVLKLPEPENVHIFERLHFSPLAASLGGPSTKAPWQPVDLPDNWRRFPSRQTDQGLYRGTFRLPAVDGEPWAVHVPTFSSNIFVSINGTLVGERLPLDTAPPLDHPLPFLARIPASLLKVGDNLIEIQLTAGGMNGGFLDQVFIGPDDDLRVHYNLRRFIAVTVPQLLVAWEVVLALGMFVLWCARPKEQAYGLFCGILVWAVLNGLPLVLVDLPLSKAVWGRLGYLADSWQATLAVPFAYHFVGRRPPLRLRWFLLLPLVVTAAYLFASDPVFKAVVYTVVLPFGLTCLFWCWWVIATSAFRTGHAGAHLVNASLIAVVAFTVHDVLIIYNLIDTHVSYLLRYSFLLVVTCIGGVFVQRFIRSLNMVDDLIDSLESRLAERERELRENFSQQRAQERRRDLEDERARLMRDMHDGLGGQLVSMVAMAERRHEHPADLVAAARAALDDLRMIVASRDIDERDLSALLGMFRERAERQLAASDIDLDWRMTSLPEIAGLNPSSGLQILRVLQEAVTNVIKHSGASAVRISVREWTSAEGDSRIELAVVDDGRGGIRQRAGSAGLSNMRARAAAIGGGLVIDSSDRGSRVRLILPHRLGPEVQATQAPPAPYPLSMGYR